MFRTYNNSRGKYLLLLKADEFLRDRSIVGALRAYDGMIVGASARPCLPTVRILDHLLHADPHRPKVLTDAVRRFEREHGLVPEAVVPITEMTMHAGLAVAEMYDLPYLARSSVEASRDKARMKAALFEAGVRTPLSRTFSSLSELREACEILGFPAIVKPNNAAHSVGVRRVSSEAELEGAYVSCQNAVETISVEWGIKCGGFQVEQFVESVSEVSVEIINSGNQHHVVAVTDKSLTSPPYFAETGHMVPSRHSKDLDVREIARCACAALGLDRGVAHVEIRIDEGGIPHVIEVAARPGGDGIMDLVERVYGINMYEQHIRGHLGQRLDVSPTSPQGTAAMAFFPNRAGTIERVNERLELPGEVVSLYIHASAGAVVGDSLHYDDRLGTTELFWPGRTDVSPTSHIELATTLRDEIFQFREEP